MVIASIIKSAIIISETERLSLDIPMKDILTRMNENIPAMTYSTIEKNLRIFRSKIPICTWYIEQSYYYNAHDNCTD